MSREYGVARAESVGEADFAPGFGDRLERGLAAYGRRQLRARLAGGAVAGLSTALVVSALVGAGVLLTGGESLREYGTTFPRVLAGYLAAGAAGGLLFGALGPLARRLPGRLGVAFAVTAVSYFAWYLAADPRDLAGRPGLAMGFALLAGAFMAPIAAFTYRARPLRRGDPERGA